MTKPFGKNQDDAPAPIPFDDALRKILKAPPRHKAAKKGATKEKKGSD